MICDNLFQKIEELNSTYLDMWEDVTAYGIPRLDSLGVVGNGTHSIKEYAEQDSLAESAKRMAAIIYCI